jgi:hypothetical protein
VTFRFDERRFVVTFRNTGMLAVHNIEVSQECMLSFMSPRIKFSHGIAGIYSERPSLSDIPKGVKIDHIAGGSSVQVDWPRFLFYKPVSSILLVKYEIHLLGLRLRFWRYVYAKAG